MDEKPTRPAGETGGTGGVGAPAGAGFRAAPASGSAAAGAGGTAGGADAAGGSGAGGGNGADRASGAGASATDAELSVRAIVFFGATLGLTMIVVCAIVWLMAVRFKGRAEALDPASSRLAEANLPRLPPEPRLQASPVADMQKLRAEEDAILTTYDWIERSAGVARIPIERAIDIVAEKGLTIPPSLRPEGGGRGAPRPAPRVGSGGTADGGLRR